MVSENHCIQRWLALYHLNHYIHFWRKQQLPIFPSGVRIFLYMFSLIQGLVTNVQFVILHGCPFSSLHCLLCEMERYDNWLTSVGSKALCLRSCQLQCPRPEAHCQPQEPTLLSTIVISTYQSYDTRWFPATRLNPNHSSPEPNPNLRAPAGE